MCGNNHRRPEAAQITSEKDAIALATKEDGRVL
jgi:hypothetical protein